MKVVKMNMDFVFKSDSLQCRRLVKAFIFNNDIKILCKLITQMLL